MTTLADLRDAVVASLSAKLAPVPVAAHGGVFDLDEVKRYAKIAPQVLVAVVGAGHDGRWKDGRWAIPVRFAAVVIARDTVVAGAKISRDVAALTLSTAVQLAVGGNRFGLEGVLQPEHMDARNEYSGPVDTIGVALWQVTWSSTLLAGDPAATSTDPTIAALVREVVNGTDAWTAEGGLASPAPDYTLPGPVLVAPDFPLRQDILDPGDGS